MKTGIQPFCIMGDTVVVKPAAQVITSSPFFNHLDSSIKGEVKALKAIRLADDPELTAKQQ